MSKHPNASKTVRMTADRYRQVVAELRTQLGENDASKEDEDSEPYDPITDMDFGYMEQSEDLGHLTKTVEDLEKKLARYKILLVEEEERARERKAEYSSRSNLFAAIRDLETELNQCKAVIAQSHPPSLENEPSIYDIDQYHQNNEDQPSFPPVQIASAITAEPVLPNGMWAAPAPQPQIIYEEKEEESCCCCCA